ncbi:kinase-like domain-containing protein [Cristinia sonorae]|uniref:Kinase-like domain-containing protein n=1 Tax=Cristinia sonorae TaxID=1940300 RepID=A0A8K0XMN7_9AGAR|nr:kinase-like domain-containing protein [Cristinia sonorae]
MHIREWRPDEYTAIESRGLVLSYAAILAHRGNVWFAVDPVTDSEYVVKALEKGDRELFILPWLLDHPALRNVVLPAEIITCEKSCLIIMPRLIPGTDLLFASHTPKHMTVMLHGFAGLIECVEVLHRNNIAHMDIDNENFVYADRDISFGSHFIKKGSVYLIDFGATRRFDSGPGTNVIIHDYKEAGGHYRPPEGKDAVDPYAYDIYSIGVNLKLCWEVSTVICQLYETLQLQ